MKIWIILCETANGRNSRLLLFGVFDIFIDECFEVHYALASFTVHDPKLVESFYSRSVIHGRFACFTIFRGWQAFPVNDFGSDREVSETAVSVHIG